MSTNEKNLENINKCSTSNMVDIIFNEYTNALEQVKSVSNKVSKGVDILVKNINCGGKIFLFGAYHLGRMATVEMINSKLDFCLLEDFIQTIVSGSQTSFTNTQNEIDDSYTLGKADITLSFINEKDTAIILCSDANLQYTRGILEVAKAKYIQTIIINNSQNTDFDCDLEIRLPYKPDKTISQIVALNSNQIVLKTLILTTMIKIGKTYKNFLIDFKVTNKYTQNQAVKLICELAKVSEEDAINTLKACNNRVKVALVMLKQNLDCRAAIKFIKTISSQNFYKLLK